MVAPESSADEALPRSVRSMGVLTRSAALRARQAQWARAMCGGLGAGLATVGAGVYGGVPLASLELYVLAAVVGAMASFTWHRSQPANPRRVMERVDERLHLGGAFLAAKESCERSPGSGITQLGAAKLLMRVKPNQVMEAAIPHTLGFTLLPLVALLGLVQAVGVRDARVIRSEAMNVEVGRVVERLDGIEERLGSRMTPEESALLDEAQAAAQEAAQQAGAQAAGETGSGDPGAGPEPADGDAEEPKADWRAKLREVANDLDDLAQSVTPGSELEKELSDAAAEAEVLAMENGEMDAPGLEEFDEAALADASPRDTGAEVQGSGAEVESSTGSATGSSATEPTEPTETGAPGGVSEKPEPGPGGELAHGAESPEGDGTSGEGVSGTPPDGRGTDDGTLAAGVPPTEGRPGSSGTTEVTASDPEQQAAEALKGRPKWWSSRNDGIVRAWAAGG